MGDFFQKY